MKKFKLLLTVDVYAEDVKDIPCYYLSDKFRDVLNDGCLNVYLHRNLKWICEEIEK
jgi:hypothetical protein